MSDRISLTDNRFAVWYEEVDGLCPLCGKALLESTPNGLAKRCEAAHIYPHSPSDEEKELLASVPKLSEIPESLDNIILLCLTCHDIFDNPRTLEGYMRMHNIKKQIIRRRDAKKHYEKNNIEEDISNVLAFLNDLDMEAPLEQLSLTALKVKEKTAAGMSSILRRSIEKNVIDYFITIDEYLLELEKDKSNASTKIALEIKLCYLSFQAQGLSQDEIYENLVEWLNQKTHRIFKHVCDIIISFYVQNCEVFSDDLPKQVS